MAIVTKGRTFVSGEIVTPTKLNTLVDSATVTGIVDADVSATAAIADTKLATISTAGKVSNSATTATSANAANTIVARDTSGNFLAGSINASSVATTGNVSVGGNVVPTWKIRTSAYTAVSGDMVAASTASASWTLTLPATPASGTMVTIIDAGGVWSARPLTVARNGSTIDGLAEDLVCDVSDKLVVLFYNGSTWNISI